MGISGHILGERKLRKLNRETGMDFDRAYNRNGQGEARMIDERGDCLHFWVDFRTMEVELLEFPMHWTSCPAPSPLRLARTRLAAHLQDQEGR